MSIILPPDALSWSDTTALCTQGFIAVAGLCLMLYDILITLDIEIGLVWPAPISAVKVLFLINRYVTPCLYVFIVYSMIGIVNTPNNPSYCFDFFLTWLTLEALSVNGIGAALMTLRVYALYGRHKGVLLLLSALLLLELVSSVAVMASGIVLTRDTAVFAEDVHACVALHHLPWLWIVFLFMMLFDIVAFYLVLRKTWKYANTIHAHTPLITVLLLDAVGYFIVMIVAEFLNIIAYTTFPSNLFLVGVNVVWCLNTTIVSRIYLNLRNAARPEDWSSLTAFNDYVPGTYERETHATDDSGWSTFY